MQCVASVPTRLKALIQLIRLDDDAKNKFFESYSAFETTNAVCSREDFLKGAPLKPLLTEGDNRIMAYYHVLNLICALGCVEKMYIPPVAKANLSLEENQILFERALAQDLNLVDNNGAGGVKHALELGCGRGRIAQHIHAFSGAHVAGINIDPSQVKEANDHARATRSGNTFLEADFNRRLPFPDGHFDAVYAVQPLTYATSLCGLFKDVRRVLKKGGRFCMLEAVLLDAYDGTNDEHVALVSPTRQLLGMGGAWHHAYFTHALSTSGFDILHSGDISENQTQVPLIRKAEQSYAGVAKGVKHLKCAGGKHLTPMLERFARNTEAFVKMDVMGLLTTSWYIFAIKK